MEGKKGSVRLEKRNQSVKRERKLRDGDREEELHE